MTDGSSLPATPSVCLRPLVHEDLPILFEFQRDPIANRMAAFPAQDRETFFASWTRFLSEPDTILQTIECDGIVVGDVTGFEKDGVRVIGCWLGREYWGRGIASRAVAQFLLVDRHRPLHAVVARHNAGSICVLHKCGFTLCGQSQGPSQTPGETVEDLIYRLA